ncbi:MAG: NAD(P)/FAD-dependent oxidoreductase [Gammaproteobacteria bacterium]|nr:NAD(P)/FAD-dependent oxidoreductase [Gammaproteobacteria bacterium]
MSEAIDAVVIGAGVVGLAVGRALARSGREVVVLEKAAAIGTETSSRNSEVVHAGIYYTPGSLKAHLCVRGRELLYRYCDSKGIEFRRCGKLIVAVTSEQCVQLETLETTARANGVHDLRRIEGAELRRMEPELIGAAALLSPSTGILDSHAMMLALQGDLEDAGGHVALHAAVEAGRYAGRTVRLTVSGDGETTDLEAGVVVNAAGLYADRVARAIADVPDGGDVPPLHYAKGNYFTYQGRSPFSHLVYPLPEEGGLGIHATLDLAGRTRFGPDVEWSETVDYTLDATRADAFYAAVRRYWPRLEDGALAPAYVGVRPKLSGPGESPADFRVSRAGEPGGATIVHLFGIESPGLTSALALADHVLERIDG